MGFEGLSEKVAVIGIGYVGLSIAAVLADRGANVIGIDINETIVNTLNSGKSPIQEEGLSELIAKGVFNGSLHATTDIYAAAEADVVILAVGTPLGENNEPDLSALQLVCKSLAPFLKKEQLIIVKSTVPPGVTRNVVGTCLEKESQLKPGIDFHLACCPERLAEGTILRDVNQLPIIVGGISKKSTDVCANFWERYQWHTIKVKGPEEAEMAKLTDNLWIDVNIALANEIAMLCEKMGIDSSEVIQAANTLPKGMHHVNILFPGPGVGGSCLTKDPWFVYSLGLKNGLTLKMPASSRSVNDDMPGYITKRAKEILSDCGISIAQSKVAVLGLAFKNKTGDMRYSPSIPLIQELHAQNADVYVSDPWVNKSEALKHVSIKEANFVSDPIEAIRLADLVIVMVAHPEFKLTPEQWKRHIRNNKPILDCRFIYNQDEMLEAGLNYFSFGRNNVKNGGGV